MLLQHMVLLLATLPSLASCCCRCSSHPRVRPPVPGPISLAALWPPLVVGRPRRPCSGAAAPRWRCRLCQRERPAEGAPTGRPNDRSCGSPRWVRACILTCWAPRG